MTLGKGVVEEFEGQLKSNKLNDWIKSGLKQAFIEEQEEFEEAME